MLRDLLCPGRFACVLPSELTHRRFACVLPRELTVLAVLLVTPACL
jgi:hypothetical protein